MKKALTSNIGLKIISVIAAFILWMIVVNIDDPMITRSYSGIPVEIINTEDITNQKKTFEILDNTDTISVLVHAKRSVIEDMSRDYLRATADMKELTDLNSIPIEVRSTRFSDRIDTLTPVTRNVRVQIEELGVKRIRISAVTTGDPEEGYVAGSAVPSVNILSVSGPASTVERISYAAATVDVTGLRGDISTNVPVELFDEDRNRITDSMIEASVTEVHVDVKILEVRTVPVTYGHITGVPADGYQITGNVILSPDTVDIAGSGKDFEAIESVEIPDDVISIAGASSNIETVIDLNRYLPSSASFADPSFDGMVTVTVIIGGVSERVLNVPAINVSIANVPEGYTAMFMDASGYKEVKVYGLSDTLKQIDANSITGVVNASSAIPEDVTAQGLPLQGTYTGEVAFNLPAGVSITEPVYMDFAVNPIETSTLPAIEAPAETGMDQGTNVMPDINNEIGEIVPDVSVTTQEQ